MMSGSKIYQPLLPPRPPFLDEGNYPAPPSHKSFFLASYIYIRLKYGGGKVFKNTACPLGKGVCVIFIRAFRKEKIDVSIFALICIDPLSAREQVDTKRATKTVPF